MSGSELKDFFLLDFIRNEIKGQINLLQEAITCLEDPSSVLSGANKGKKCTEELLKLLKIRPWNLLILAVQHLDDYFQLVQDGMVVIPLHIQTLRSIERYFLSLLEFESSQLEEIIEEQKEVLSQLDSQLAQITTQCVDEKLLEKTFVETSTEKQSSLSIESKKSSVQSFDVSMFDIFCTELEIQIQLLSEGLIEIERKPKDQKLLEILMRAAHSIKGAARVVHLDPIVHLAHSMEDFFVAVQRNKDEITPSKIDRLLRGVDVFARLIKVEGKHVVSWFDKQLSTIQSLTQEIACLEKRSTTDDRVKKIDKSKDLEDLFPLEIKPIEKIKKNQGEISVDHSTDRERTLRVTADNLNRIMGLAGECLVNSHSLNSLSTHLHQIKNKWSEIEELFYLLSDSLEKENLSQMAQNYLNKLKTQIHSFLSQSAQRMTVFDNFFWEHAHFADRLYAQAIKCRMRPFSDGIEGFPRMVRDLARKLGKQAILEVEGKSTLVDRDILEKLESPLTHLLRNAIDHGIENPEERGAAGKSMEGVIKLKAHYLGGMLAITVSDDGRGIDIESLRKKIVEKNLTTDAIAERLTESEVIDFLFLPGFSTASVLTEISGRGVGLNIVQTILQEVGGGISIQSLKGKGTSFHLRLPLTLSVIRALLVEISGEPYAFPLARIDQAFTVPRESIKYIENRQYFEYEEQNIGLVAAWEILDLNEPHLKLEILPIIVLKEGVNSYGLIVDRFIGEKELVVQELDPRLGKIPDISAGALMEDGSPVLIVDVEDFIRSTDHLLSGGRLVKISYTAEGKGVSNKKRILIVEDSLTVREVECRLLTQYGYEVETAINGIDGWNAVQINHYDLVITDIDMPRMNGIDLLKTIRKDPKLQNLPVIIVSYKEGDEERKRGLEAGANFYLTKGSFQDATLIETVKKLVQ